MFPLTVSQPLVGIENHEEWLEGLFHQEGKHTLHQGAPPLSLSFIYLRQVIISRLYTGVKGNWEVIRMLCYSKPFDDSTHSIFLSARLPTRPGWNALHKS